jgi:hypothetical protein
MMFTHYTSGAKSARAVDLAGSTRRHCGSEPSDRRANVIVPTVLMMVVLVGMLAFAVDVGYVAHVETDLQRTADAAALAAAAKLPSMTTAVGMAHTVAAENGWSSWVKIGDGDELHGEDVDPLDVHCGYWDRDTVTFTTPAPSNREPNAVRVILRRTEATGNPLRLFFGQVFGVDTANVEVSATACYDRWLCGPFVGIDWLSVPGTPDTDSYDSRGGPYQEALARVRGSVCSDGPVNIDGNSLIRGHARAGKGHDVTMTGGATVTQSIGSRQKPLNLNQIDASVAAIDNDNAQIPLIPKGNGWMSPVDAQGNLLLDGTKQLDLPPGTYYLNNFILAGQAVLNVSGTTTIYLTGNLSRSGGCLVGNSTKKPANLQFLMTGGTALVTSENDFYGVIYAPNSDVTIDGSADYFGAAVGKTLSLTGSGKGHYDESLNLDTIEFPRRTTLVD